LRTYANIKAFVVDGSEAIDTNGKIKTLQTNSCDYRTCLNQNLTECPRKVVAIYLTNKKRGYLDGFLA
jgi:hypothetical protein